jgi:hypothetical protein
MANQHPFGLDVAKGAAMAQKEQYGDWYRDPWGWPEWEWLRRDPGALPLSDLLESRRGVNFRHPIAFTPILVPKSRLGTRPAVLMTPDVHLFYNAATLRIGDMLNEHLSSWVYGWRTHRQELLENNDQWVTYSSFFTASPHAVEEVSAEPYGLRTDITSFFASIDVERIISHVYERTGSTAASTIIESVLRDHDKSVGRSGIPQRSAASSILANAYLRPCDDLIEAALQRGEISRAARWMDDIHAMGTEESLYALHLKLQERSRDIGLELNASKSAILPAAVYRDDFEIGEIASFRTDRPAFQAYFAGYDDAAHGQLRQVEATVLGETQFEPGRPFAKGLLRELRDRGEYGRVNDWLLHAYRFPHIADALARYFNSAARAGDLAWGVYIEWLQSFLASPFGSLAWVKGQFMLAVPSNEMTMECRNILTNWLETSVDIQLVGVAVQRLALRDTSAVRDLIRERMTQEPTSLMMRSLALGLLSAGGERSAVRSGLAAMPRNMLSLALFDVEGSAAFRVPRDFDSSA